MSRNFFVLALLCLFGCQRVPNTIEPSVNYALQEQYIQSLPSPFPPLSEQEKREPFGQEILIGSGFADELDLYQALTAFKRAEFLLPSLENSRLAQIQYETLLCYYMGRKWSELLHTFQHSTLRHVDPSFPAFHDLLLILYESYTQNHQLQEATQMLQLIHSHYPQEASDLYLSTALIRADFPSVEASLEKKPSLQTFLDQYETRKKSVAKAQWLNALLPGAGYFYLGQGTSAFTAFCLNGLFIAASVCCFQQHNIAAGAILTSFEAGWYFGGIYGAGLEAKAYNERLYESLATPYMMKEKLFPGLMIHYAF